MKSKNKQHHITKVIDKKQKVNSLVLITELLFIISELANYLEKGNKLNNGK